MRARPILLSLRQHSLTLCEHALLWLLISWMLQHERLKDLATQSDLVSSSSCCGSSISMLCGIQCLGCWHCIGHQICANSSLAASFVFLSSSRQVWVRFLTEVSIACLELQWVL